MEIVDRSVMMSILPVQSIEGTWIFIENQIKAVLSTRSCTHLNPLTCFHIELFNRAIPTAKSYWSLHLFLNWA